MIFSYFNNTLEVAADERSGLVERLHLELQLEFGKQDAPYKEVIVKEAIANTAGAVNAVP